MNHARHECFFVLGHKKQGLVFSLNDNGTRMVVGEMTLAAGAEKRKKPMLFKQHIYLNPVKTIREYEQDGFELMTTLCVMPENSAAAIELYLSARLVKGSGAMKALLTGPDAGYLLELLLNMEGNDDESKAMQIVAEEVLVANEQQQAPRARKGAGNDHAG